jgi:hypothetical protein
MLVTAYYNIYELSKFKSYLELFTPLGKSGLPIVVFTDEVHAPAFSDFPSITLIIRPLESYEMYKIGMAYMGELPSERTVEKDTKEFFSLMNTKIEFVKLAFESFPEEKTMAWIDFAFLKMIKNPVRVIEKLREILVVDFKKMMFPGCWSFGYGISVDVINWRFCGTFFIMPKAKVESFFGHCKNVVTDFCTNPSYRLTWETNVWALVEYYAEKEDMHWYFADHNDTLIMNAL